MATFNLVRAWKDPDVRDEQCPPVHPAGEITLPAPGPAGGFSMAVQLAGAVMPASSEYVPGISIGCCFCNCGCGTNYGCNRNDCP